MKEDRGLEINVDFYGLRTLTTALRRVAPDLLVELEKNTRAPMSDLRNRTRRMVTIANRDIPSGWKRPGGGAKGWGDRNQRRWEPSKVKNGVKLNKNRRTKAGVTYFWTVRSTSPAGAIYEFAKNPRTPQGRSFVRALNRQPTSRLLWRAYDEMGGADMVDGAVLRSIRDVEVKFSQRAAMVEGGDKVGIS